MLSPADHVLIIWSACSIPTVSSPYMLKCSCTYNVRSQQRISLSSALLLLWYRFLYITVWTLLHNTASRRIGNRRWEVQCTSISVMSLKSCDPTHKICRCAPGFKITPLTTFLTTQDPRGDEGVGRAAIFCGPGYSLCCLSQKAPLPTVHIWAVTSLELRKVSV